MEQYPDILLREGDLPSNGIPCRFIPNKGRGVVKIVDGAEVETSYTIALPQDAPQLLIGELVSARDASGEYIVYDQPIALFHRGQFHCKAYI